MNYSEKDRAFQITTRIFTDDLEAVLLERYGIKTELATEKEAPLADELIEKYLKTKLVVTINGSAVPYTYLGKEYDTDITIGYLEIPDIDLASLKQVQIQNEVLTDLFEEQQNIVHLKIGDKKKSFILVRENNKGMLNL